MRQKGFVHILLLIIVVILGIGALGYYSWQNYSIRKNSETNNSSRAQTPTSTIPISINPTVNIASEYPWKIYRSDKVLFEYPGDWIVDKKYKRVYAPDNWGVSLYEKEGEIAEYVCLDTTSKVVTTKNNLIAQKFRQKVPSDTNDICWGAGMETEIFVYISKINDSNRYGAVYYYSIEQEAKAQKIFDQILSTFKFTE